MATIIQLQKLSLIAKDPFEDGETLRVNLGEFNLVLDLDNLSTLIEEMKSAQTEDFSTLEAFKGKHTVHEAILHDLYAVQSATEKVLRPKALQDMEARDLFYQAASHTLSNVIETKNVACIEMSILSKQLLEEKGYQVLFVGGSYSKGLVTEIEKTLEFTNAIPHAFLIVTDPETNRNYIYDPTNPATSGDNPLPYMMEVSAQDIGSLMQNSRQHQKQTFVGNKGVWHIDQRYYGFSDAVSKQGLIMNGFSMDKVLPEAEQSLA